MSEISAATDLGFSQAVLQIVGLAKAMMRNCVRVEGLHDAVDIVGTGGDGIGTVNISTGSTILPAGTLKLNYS